MADKRPLTDPSRESPSRVADRYDVIQRLGEGTSKEVFLAWDNRLERDVALGRIKTVEGMRSLPPRVLQEIRTTARLDHHPHIVTVYDVIEEPGTTWIVSQYVAGGSLAQLLRTQRQGLEVSLAMRLSREVADALHFAHEHGVIHRDVKPSNVLLSEADNSALLADFGVARLLDHPSVTATGALVGTAAYMSPEQALTEAVDRRADLYGLGVMLFELVCGRTPFAADSIVAVLMKHVDEPAPRASDVNPGVPEALSRLILQLMSKRPEDRPASGLAVCQALDALTSSSVVAVRDDGPGRHRLPESLAAATERPFVGRRDAIEALGETWERAATERSQLAVITGEAGIGKTSLATAFAHRVYDEGAVVLYGRCDEDPLVSYQPFVEALRQLIVDDPDVVSELDSSWSAELAELSRLIPELRRRPSTMSGTSRRDSLERYQLFEAILALISPTVHRRRMLLVLDDMQWADEPTELLLRHLMRAPLHGLMVLVTRRPSKPAERDPLVKVLADLKRDVGGDRRLIALSIVGLDVRETHQLASAQRERPVDREFSQLLRTQTAGNPFFIEQVLRGLGDVDLSTAQQAAAAMESLRVPQEVQEFIDYRLAGFSGDVRELLAQAAVCGPEFRVDVLAKLRSVGTGQIIDLLREPLAAGLIVEPAIARYAFSHALVRETLYGRRLGKSERAQLHLRIGETLESMPSQAIAAAELARHFHAAREIGGAKRTVEYALTAAHDAGKALAYEAAAAFTHQACDALECMGEDHDLERCRLLRVGGRLLWQAGDQKGAQSAFLASATLARKLGNPSQLARAALGYAGRSYDAEGIDPNLRQLFDEALETVPAAETSLRAKLLARLADALHPVDGPHALDLTTEALDILSQSPDDDALTTVEAARHVVLLHIDHHNERFRVSKEWARLAEERRHDSTGPALNWRLYDLLERGDAVDMEEVHRTRKRLGELAETLRQPLLRHFVESFDAKLLLMEGEFADAEQKAREGYMHGVRAQGTHVALLFGGQRFALLREQGRLPELKTEVSSFLDTEHPTLPAWRAALTVVACDAGDLERAHTELTALSRDGFSAIPADMFWLGTMCMLAECAAELGDVELGAALKVRLDPYAAYNAQIGLSVMFGPVHGFLGRLGALLGGDEFARRQFEMAIDRCTILGAQPALARVRCHYGELLLSSGGDRQLARDLLEQSHGVALELGMAGIADRAGGALELIVFEQRLAAAEP